MTAIARPSLNFTDAYGNVSEIVFNISAKHHLIENDIKGPAFFKKGKEIEFTIFLPYDQIMKHADAPRQALLYLLDGVCHVFGKMKIEAESLNATKSSIIERICSDHSMLSPPSWDDAQNNTIVRTVFQDFFANHGKSN